MEKIIDGKLSGRHKKWMRLINDLKDKKILDIGCSYGWFEGFAVKSNYKEIFAIEPNEKDFAEAKEKVPQAHYLEGSALNIPFQNDYFDVVTIFDVIEHLSYNTEIKALKEISRVLKPGGILYLSIPHRTVLSNLLDPAWYFGHRHYSKRRIVNFLTQSGFRVNLIECGGGLFSQLYMILFYFNKLFFRKETTLFRNWFDKKREEEYLNKKGFVTIFVKARKLDN